MGVWRTCFLKTQLLKRERERDKDPVSGFKGRLHKSVSLFTSTQIPTLRSNMEKGNHLEINHGKEKKNCSSFAMTKNN